MKKRVKDSWNVLMGWDMNIQWTASSSFFFSEIGSGPPQRHRIILISTCFLTLTRLVLSHLNAQNHLSILFSIFYLSTLGSLVQSQRTEQRTVFELFYRSSSFSSVFSLLGIKIFSGLYNFPNAHAILAVTLFAYVLRGTRLLSTKKPTQLTWHFRWGTSFIVFT